MSLIFLISLIIIFFLVPFYFNKFRVKGKVFVFLPTIFKIAGIIILIICAIAPALSGYNDFPILHEIKQLLIIVGLLVICLSREKVENEDITSKRIVTLLLSITVVIVVGLVFLTFELVNIEENYIANFFNCILASYLLVFHWFRKAGRAR